MRLLSLMLALLALLAGTPAAAAPRVVATIAPVHSLVAAVMQGTGEPGLLVPAALSPHEFALKPSAAAAMAEADVVVWVGPALETALVRPLATLAADATLVTLSEVPGIEPIPLGERGEDTEATGAGAAVDPHFWLDPEVGALWAAAIAEALGRADPDNAARYRENAEALAETLAALSRDLDARLAPVRGRGFAVLHDAFRYFGRRFGIAPAAVLSEADAARPGARRIAEVVSVLQALDRPCLFAEPQENAALAEQIAAESGARTATLDPLGAGLEPGPSLYPALLRGIAEALSGCLEGGA